MRTSLIETERIEAYLHRSAAPEDLLLFDAKLILNSALSDKTMWQQKAYNVVRLYGRDMLKQEIEAVHQKLFNEPQYTGFREKIKRLFTNDK